MGKKKIRKPQPKQQQPVPIPPGLRYALTMESRLAMDEYRARKHVRERMAQSDEINRQVDERDAHLELWMWGCMALVLHRRYHWTPKTIAKIFGEIQALHNEVYDSELSHEETSKKIVELVGEEIGMELVGEL